MTIHNNSERLMRLTFQDKDVIHLFHGETLTFPDYFSVIRQELI